MYFDNLNDKYIILDIEGNATSKKEERRITQFAALIVENNNISEINWMNRNVNIIHPYVAKMTHISLSSCKENGFSERNLVSKIHELISNCKVIYAYGCDFDKEILSLMFKKYHLPMINTPWIDILKDVKKYLCPSKLKLSIAASEYGFENEDFHNALTDCKATLYLMNTIENIRKVSVL